jgi:hypothetical protein
VSRVDPSKIDEATAETRRRARRTTPGIAVMLAIVVSLAVLAWRMVPHPVGAARTYGKYEGKAVTTAESALSNVETVRLAARTATAGNAFGPYTTVVISDAEEGLSGVQGTFDSIQPPDDRADALAQDLDTLLSDALEHVREVRVAVRRGVLDELATVAEPLTDDASKLDAFKEQHS